MSSDKCQKCRKSVENRIRLCDNCFEKWIKFAKDYRKEEDKKGLKSLGIGEVWDLWMKEKIPFVFR